MEKLIIGVIAIVKLLISTIRIFMDKILSIVIKQ